MYGSDPGAYHLNRRFLRDYAAYRRSPQKYPARGSVNDLEEAAPLKPLFFLNHKKKKKIQKMGVRGVVVRLSSLSVLKVISVLSSFLDVLATHSSAQRPLRSSSVVSATTHEIL